MDDNDGVIQEDVTPIDGVEGVYPTSYFDLNKYPSHWKLVGGIVGF